jgi:hypothetical protein
LINGIGRPAYDLVNKKFGKLTVIERYIDETTLKYKCSYWLCRCDCGKTRIIRGTSLIEGDTKSCGCLISEMKSTVIIGKIYGKLKALNKTEIKNGEAFYECQCECGNIVEVRGGNLVTGGSKSCGCQRTRTRIDKSIAGESAFNHIYANYKCLARRRKINFQLTKEEFREIINQNCFYCNKSPSNIDGKYFTTGSYLYSGIDRIDSNLGYIIGNVVPCCKICNVMKSNLSKNDFLNHIKQIYHFNINNTTSNN